MSARQLQRLPLLPTLLASLALSGCADELSPPAESGPPLELPVLYRVTPTWCTSECWTLTLYRDMDSVELRATEPAGEFIARSEGVLSEAASAELDGLLGAVLDGSQELGEHPGMTPLDGPLVTFWLGAVELSYPSGYPPSGLAQLDALVAKVHEELARCQASERLGPNADCEPLW